CDEVWRTGRIFYIYPRRVKNKANSLHVFKMCKMLLHVVEEMPTCERRVLRSGFLSPVDRHGAEHQRLVAGGHKAYFLHHVFNTIRGMEPAGCTGQVLVGIWVLRDGIGEARDDILDIRR